MEPMNAVTALALVRFAHFMGAMLTFGISAFLACAPERLRLALSPALRRLAVVRHEQAPD